MVSARESRKDILEARGLKTKQTGQNRICILKRLEGRNCSPCFGGEWGHCFYMTFFFSFFPNEAVIFKLCTARGWPVIRGQRVEGQNRQEFEDLFRPCWRACLTDPCSAWRGQPCGFDTGDKSPPDLRSWLGANLWGFAEGASINLHVSIYQYNVMHGCNLAPCFGCFIPCIISFIYGIYRP